MSLSGTERYRDLLSPENFDRLLKSLEKPVPTSIRINPLKVDPEPAMKTLSSRYGWAVEPVSFCPDGWTLGSFDTPPGNTLEYRNGHYYIQEASSMLPAEALGYDHGETPMVLDMAAAPGGKTTHLAALARDKGVLVANDVSQRRLRPLIANLRTWGTTSTLITHLPGERLGEWLPEMFDKVLLDAPCSGQSLRSSSGSRGREISAREWEALQQQQIGMLLSGLKALRQGGKLVYATCTAAPEENEAVIQAALNALPGLVELEGIDLAEKNDEIRGLTTYGDHSFGPAMSRSIRLWPFQFDTGAFFTARLRKLDSIKGGSPLRMQVATPDPLDDPQREKIQQHLLRFGFNLEAVCQEMKLTLITQDRFIHAAPIRWFEQLPGLQVRGAGLPLGRWQGDTFLPTHEWVTRFDSMFTQRRFTLEADQAGRWLQGLDLRDWRPPGVDGPILLQDEHGRFLGVGNSSPQRVRNLLPRAWVAG